jgi:hypothetical protein
MSIDGSYKIVTRTPMGPQDGTLVVTTSGNVLTGKMVTGFGTVELSDGRVDGVNLSWKAAMKQPFPVVLECSAVWTETISPAAQKPERSELRRSLGRGSWDSRHL